MAHVIYPKSNEDIPTKRKRKSSTSKIEWLQRLAFEDPHTLDENPSRALNRAKSKLVKSATSNLKKRQAEDDKKEKSRAARDKQKKEDSNSWLSFIGDEDNYPEIYLTEEEILEAGASKALKHPFVKSVEIATWLDTKRNRVAFRINGYWFDVFFLFLLSFLATRKLQKYFEELKEFRQYYVAYNFRVWNPFRKEKKDGIDWIEVSNQDELANSIASESTFDREIKKLESEEED